MTPAMAFGLTPVKYRGHATSRTHVRSPLSADVECTCPLTHLSFPPQLIRGEFDVIKELLATEPSAAEGKKKIDHVIDVCGPAPKGNGLQNLRECIIETKWKYDVAPEEKQACLHLNERSYYLIHAS